MLSRKMITFPRETAKLEHFAYILRTYISPWNLGTQPIGYVIGTSPIFISFLPIQYEYYNIVPRGLG